MGSGLPFAMRVGEGVFESVGGICEKGVEVDTRCKTAGKAGVFAFAPGEG